MDCQAHPSICRVAGVNAYPSVRFYPPTKPGEKKTIKHNINSQVSSPATDVAIPPSHNTLFLQDPQQIVAEVDRILIPFVKKGDENISNEKVGKLIYNFA